MTVETISNNNIPALAHLMVALWPDSSLEEELESCHEILNGEKETVYLIRHEGAYIAFIHITMRFEYVEGSDTSPVAYIEGMYVKEDHRHLGVGKRLIELAEAWAKQNGCKQLASDTELANDASVAFHKKAGFIEVNRIVCFVKAL